MAVASSQNRQVVKEIRNAIGRRPYLARPQHSFPEQHLGFRPPEQQLPPPAWWTGPRAGDILGGGMTNPNVVRQWWRDLAEPGDKFVVQLVAEDCISGDKVRRTPDASNVQAES